MATTSKRLDRTTLFADLGYEAELREALRARLRGDSGEDDDAGEPATRSLEAA